MAKKVNPESDNALVKELRDVEFIKQPYLYAMIGADFTLVQRSIMIEIMNSLQTRFNAFLKHQKCADETGQLSLFTEEERHKEMMTFKISAASLGVKPNQYGELQEACDNLYKIHFSYLEYDKSTGTFMRTYANLFSTISMPVMLNSEYKYKYEHKDENDPDKGKRRRSNYIVARMDIKVLEYLCNLNNGQGYIDHIYRIARISKCKRTPGIYIYLARWAKDFSKKAVDYVELKKFLGIITQVIEKSEGGKTEKKEVDKYPKFSKFCKEVMDPIKKDLDRLANDNQVEFSFEYEPVYKTAVKRGDPKEILFKIKLSGLGEELRKQRKLLHAPADIWTLLRGEFKFTDADIKALSDILPPDMTDAFRLEVMALIERMKKMKVNNKKAYAITSLRNYIMQNKPENTVTKSAGTFPEHSTENTQHIIEVPAPGDEDMEKWDRFVAGIKERVGNTAFDTWFSCLGIVSFENDVLTVSVPTKYIPEYIEDKYFDAYSTTFREVFGESTQLKYKIDKF